MSTIQEQDVITSSEVNNLFPVFMKLENFRVLIVGGGSVAQEKLITVLSNSPQTKINLVGITINEEIKKLASLQSNVTLNERPFSLKDIMDSHVVISAVNDRETSEKIFELTKANRKLINSADIPELCDFYLGSVVRKGNLKIAISTNGKSPTIAKRLKEVLADALPMQIDDVLTNMSVIRGKLNGSFHEKVEKLNEITKELSADVSSERKATEKRWRRIATYSLFAFFFMFLGHLVLSYIPFSNLWESLSQSISNLDSNF